MANRRKGTGTIYKVGEVYYGKIMVGGKLHKLKLTQNKRESESLWSDWLLKNRPVPTEKSAKHPLDEVWPSVRDGLLAEGYAQDSIDKYYAEIQRAIEYFGAKTDVAAITKGMLVDYIRSRSDGVSGTLQNKIVAVFRRIYSEVLPDLLPTKNPTVGFTTARDESVSRQPLTAEETDRLLKAARECGPEWEAIFTIGLYTGLRFTDCCHLHTSQVHDGLIFVTPKKTKRKVMTRVQIPLHEELKECLDSLNVSDGYYLPSLVAMCDNKKKRSLLGYYTKKVFVKAGIETSQKVEGRKRAASVKCFHALRATFISRLAESNVNLGIIRDMAGHVSDQVTQIYVHPNLDTKKAAIDSLPNFRTGESGTAFVDPTIQKILDEAKRQIAEVLGNGAEIKLSLDYCLTDFAKQNQQDGETLEQTMERLHLDWKHFKA